MRAISAAQTQKPVGQYAAFEQGLGSSLTNAGKPDPVLAST